MSQSADQDKSTSSSKQRVILDADTELNRLAMLRYRRRNWLVGLGLLAGVLSIYGYSMYAVKQESLDLDELDEQVRKDSSVTK